MAKVIITYVSAEGDKIQAIASGKIRYPDCLDLRETAVEAFQDALTYAFALEGVMDAEGANPTIVEAEDD